MIDAKHVAALLGFAFAAAWIGFNFGYAVLCLVGAGVFHYAAAYLQGEVDVGELQGRFGPQSGLREQARMPQPKRTTPRVR